MNNQKKSSLSSEQFEMLLKKSKIIIYSILGPSRADISPLAYAIAITADRLYIQKIPLNIFTIYNDVYYKTAKLLNQDHPSTARSVARIANRITKAITTQEETEKYFGEVIYEPIAPRMLIIYLAAYVYFDKPYYQVLKDSYDP